MAKKVLVVDDSFVMRTLIGDIIKKDKDLELVGAAENGKKGLEDGPLGPQLNATDAFRDHTGCLGGLTRQVFDFIGDHREAVNAVLSTVRGRLNGHHAIVGCFCCHDHDIQVGRGLFGGGGDSPHTGIHILGGRGHRMPLCHRIRSGGKQRVQVCFELFRRSFDRTAV